MPRHTEEAKARFRALVPADPGVEVRPMFGSVGAFVNGHMFAGLFGTDLGVKLDPEGLEELRAVEGSGPFGPNGRPMGGWVAMPATFTDEENTAWMDRAREHIARLPPKPRTRKT